MILEDALRLCHILAPTEREERRADSGAPRLLRAAGRFMSGLTDSPAGLRVCRCEAGVIAAPGGLFHTRIVLEFSKSFYQSW